MKRMHNLIIVLFLVGLLLLNAGTVNAYDSRLDTDEGDKVVIGESFILPAGKTLDGGLIVFGGSAVLEAESVVTGDVVLTASDLTVSGQVLGNIISIGGGQLEIKETAEIQGDVIAVASVMEREDGAVIRGDTIGSMPGSMPFSFSSFPDVIMPDIWGELHPLRKFLGDVFNMLVLSGLAALVMLVAPASTKKVSHTLAANPFLAGLFGLLSLIMSPFVVVLLAITLILIPVIPLLVLALVLVLLWGWIAMGVEVGRRIQEMAHLGWAEPLVAALGVFILTFLVNALGWLSGCCLEFPVATLLLSVGLGGVFLSRFGTQDYRREISSKE